MSFLKNKFVIVVIVAILLGGVTGLYLSKMNTPKAPVATSITSSSGSAANAEKVGEVMRKLNDLTKD